jgi:hypothetical protein
VGNVCSDLQKEDAAEDLQLQECFPGNGSTSSSPPSSNENKSFDANLVQV